MTWPWSKPTPPPAPVGSPERALRLARAADDWNVARRQVAGLTIDVAFLAQRLAEKRKELDEATAFEVTVRARLEEATRAP